MMIDRQYVPFDVFGMREEVRVSTMVRVGDLGWTCGMCPLDVSSAVVAAGDLQAQAGFVSNMIETVFQRAGFDSKDAAKLVIYHAAKSADELSEMLTVFKKHFPSRPVLVPVPVDHFYYEGMLLEVDAYADASLEPASEAVGPGIQVRHGHDFTYIAATVSGFDQIEAALDSNKLHFERLLAAEWYSERSLASLDPAHSPFSIEYQEFVQVGSTHTASLSSDLTFASQLKVEAKVIGEGVLVRRTDDLVMLSGSVARSDLSLVDQTRAIMERLDAALREEGLAWSHVVKISAPYVGGASETDLHENLKIRHAFHVLPGPASTGLPVRAFADPDFRIVVRLTAHR